MGSSNVVRIQLAPDIEPGALRRELGIVAGVPVPKINRKAKLRDQIANCNIDDSFLTRKDRSVCYRHARNLGVKVICRPQKDGYIRVWRVK